MVSLSLSLFVFVKYLALLIIERKSKTTTPTQNQERIQDFKVGGTHLKKIAPTGGRRENLWGISCEKSQFYAKKILFFPILGGACAGCAPPLDPPLGTVLKYCRKIVQSEFKWIPLTHMYMHDCLLSFIRKGVMISQLYFLLYLTLRQAWLVSPTSNYMIACDRQVVFSGYSCFLHQLNWPQHYNWNIVESGVKHHKPNQSIP